MALRQCGGEWGIWKAVANATGKEKGFQDSPDVPWCGLPIGIMN